MLLLALFLTRPSYAVDSDGDGLSDADEILAHLPPSVADSDGDGKVDYLDPDMDGDTIPNVDECRLGGVSGLAMVNGSFELPDLNIPYTVSYPNDGEVPGWRTTGGVFEFWGSGMEGKWAYEGDQFAELNAFSASTLYQDITTSVGDVYIYAYSHRARFGGGDVMRFNLGPPSGPLTTIRTSTTGSGAWGRYGGIITISQPSTRFAFESVSSSCGGGCGNFLDAISFTPVCDLDTDLDGKPDALDTDSDNDGYLDNVDVCPGEDDNTADPDADLVCGAADTCPLDPWNDSDADGVCGDVDVCAGFNDADDLDNDAIPDGCDSDQDGDGYDESVDCNERDALINVKTTLYFDMDGDTYGNPGMSQQVCPPYFLPMRVTNDDDCNDTLATISPAAVELPDGIDQDCDLLIDEGTINYDDDNDGFTEVAGDCDDTDVYVFPGQVEAVNGIDDDCNVLVDDGTSAFDDDNDGYSEDEGDCNDEDVLYNPTAVETPDGTDEDCDLVIDDGTVLFDDDNDGYTELDGDCDDADPDLGLPRTFFEDDDNDGFGWSLSSTVACVLPPHFSESDEDCDDRDETKYPGAVESCVDREDRNCDGSAGFDDRDNDRWAACEECDDMTPATHPGAYERCLDGIDNNCDGRVDEDCDVAVNDTDDTDIDSDSLPDSDVVDSDPPTDLDTDVIPMDSDECFDEEDWNLAGGWSCRTLPSDPPMLPLAGLVALGMLRRRKSYVA